MKQIGEKISEMILLQQSSPAITQFILLGNLVDLKNEGGIVLTASLFVMRIEIVSQCK